MSASPASAGAASLGSPEALRATARGAGHLAHAQQGGRSGARPRGQLKGRQPTDTALAEVRALIGTRPLNGHRRDLLIEHLHRINDRFNGLPDTHLVALAHEMDLSMAEVHEVASFYHHFEVLPAGQTGPALTVRVCDGLSCQLAGAAPLLADLQARLPGLLGKPGEAGVRVTHAPCVGRCDQAPAVQVGQLPLAHATVDRVVDTAQAAVAAAQPVADVSSEKKWPFSHIHHHFDAPETIEMAAYVAQGGYRLAQAVASGEREAEPLIAALEHAGLRGLGGAGFPTGRKWRIVRGHPGVKLMAVNIDEGEPGTFKDRWYLERDPHRFLEGLLIAAHVVGCSAVYIYLRDEYHHARHLLTQALDDLRNSQLFAGQPQEQLHPLGGPGAARVGGQLFAGPPQEPLHPLGGPGSARVGGHLPPIALRRGAGAYICGEESAMIESIEGKRGEPRLRPPYIAEKGLFGRPTLEHNFETLYWVRDILEKGPDWFASQGRHGRKGLRSFSVSGRVKQPGVKLAPAGTTLRELVDEFCGGMADGHTLYAYLPGGASGGIFPASLADVPLDFDTLQPHGGFIGSAAVVVLGQTDLARDAALNQMRFFAAESCGQCTPCRVGTAKAAQLLEAPVWDVDTLQDLNAVMTDASICGLGQAAPNPVACVIRYFPHEIGLPSAAPDPLAEPSVSVASTSGHSVAPGTSILAQSASPAGGAA